MSCCGSNPGFEEIDEVSRLVAKKLAAFLKTLRDNGFAVGLDVRDLHDAPETVHETLMCLLKTHEDKSRVTREVSERLLAKVA